MYGTPTLGMAVPEPDWRMATLCEGAMWAREYSAYDPDQPHPPMVMDLLRCRDFDRERRCRDVFPSVEAFVRAAWPTDQWEHPHDRRRREALEQAKPKVPEGSIALFDVPAEVLASFPARSIEAAPVKRVVSQAMQTLELDLFAATPLEPEPTPDEALELALAALAAATDAKGEVPTMDDCHRRRYGLPGMAAMNRAGGWHAVLVRFRAELRA